MLSDAAKESIHNVYFMGPVEKNIFLQFIQRLIVIFLF